MINSNLQHLAAMQNAAMNQMNLCGTSSINNSNLAGLLSNMSCAQYLRWMPSKSLKEQMRSDLDEWLSDWDKYPA